MVKPINHALLDDDEIKPPPLRTRYMGIDDCHWRISIYNDFWIVESQNTITGEVYIPKLLEVKKTQTISIEI